MRIAVDATPLVNNPTGVGTFVAGLIESLKSFDRPRLAPAKVTGTTAAIEVVEFALTTPATYRRKLSELAHSARRWLPGTGKAGNEPDSPVNDQGRKMLWLPPSVAPWVWHLTKLPIERSVGPVDVVHGTSFMVPPTRAAHKSETGRSALRVVTVHDLTYLMADETPRRVRWWDNYVRQALSTGAVIHTQSEFIAKEVRQHYGTNRVRTARPAVDLHSAAEIAAAKRHPLKLREESSGRGFERFGEQRPYILALGFSQPRKRLPLLVRAFQRISAKVDCELLLVGPPGLDEPALQAEIDRLAPGKRDRVIKSGWVPDDQRNALLAQAAVLAFPSVYEGFGYPALEAMALQTPVVAAQAGSLPEAVGDAALLVPPDDVDALAVALERVLTDSELSASLVSKGNAHLAAHTHAQAAADMIALYNEFA